MAFDSASGYNNLPSGNFTPEIFSQKVLKFFRRGAVVNPQDLADDQITMVVDQANAFAFKIDDIEERQSHVNFEALATSSGAYSLKRKYDANVLDSMATAAGLTGESGASVDQ